MFYPLGKDSSLLPFTQWNGSEVHVNYITHKGDLNNRGNLFTHGQHAYLQLNAIQPQITLHEFQLISFANLFILAMENQLTQMFHNGEDKKKP